jgi:DNA-binding transcriptional ArsR family regulator
VAAMKNTATIAARSASLAAELRPKELAELQANASRACGVLKAIANDARLLLVCELAGGEKSVGQLQASVGLSQSSVSQHLAILREHHVVKTRRHHQSVYYDLAGPEVSALIKTLHEQFCTKRR